MQEVRPPLYTVPDTYKDAWMSEQDYQSLYQYSLENTEDFWGEMAKHFLNWFTLWTSVYEGNFSRGEVSWFKGGKLNVSVNCIDRHLPDKADKIAILWEGDTPDKSRQFTYQQLHDEVCKLANALKSEGVNKGDRVCIYMPMIPEAAFAMLACARIGAVHSVVFGGFSSHTLANRIIDYDCRLIITADAGVRGGVTTPLKERVDDALKCCSDARTVLVVKHANIPVEWNDKRDVWYHDAVTDQLLECEPEAMNSEDPMFILYTSGSTGKPKGALHSTAGYLLYATMTFHFVFDHRKEDIYWCTADIGWITGHSYVVYGPLSNGATTLMYSGLPYWPTASRIWEIVDRYNVNTLYLAPTAIRALMSKGNDFVKRTSRRSLKLLGSVGEPINPEAWHWLYQVVGESQCPIMDTWWQTETGGIMITPLPGATPLKPGAATRPFPGIRPALLDEEGNEIIGAGEGSLVITGPWPGQIRTVYGSHQRLIDTYFKQFPGYYFTGDGARRDEDGYYWITGRVDDVLNVSGYRLGTAEIESALVLHPEIAEAAVVGTPNPVKGENVFAFVTPIGGVEGTPELEGELVKLVVSEIGVMAKPEAIRWTNALPRTRSGKVMRRILRKIAGGHSGDLGDISTLANPEALEQLKK